MNIDDEIFSENVVCHITEKYQVAKIEIPEIRYVYLINLRKIEKNKHLKYYSRKNSFTCSIFFFLLSKNRCKV